MKLTKEIMQQWLDALRGDSDYWISPSWRQLGIVDGEVVSVVDEVNHDSDEDSTTLTIKG